MPAANPAILAHNLAIGYGTKVVGTGISFALHANEVLCLLGPNGSGKSTLFKTVMGLIPAKGGDLSIMNKAMPDWTRRGLARHVAYVPQAHDGVFAFTVEEMVLMGRTARIGPYAVPGVHDRDIAYRCLQRLDIQHLQDQPYSEISGGEKQLTLIARAMAQEPSILIMDEPTASLDFGNQIRVLDHIRQLKELGVAVLLCTHQPEHAFQVADRVALFRNGHIHGCDAPTQIMTPVHLAWLYDLQPHQIPPLGKP